MIYRPKFIQKNSNKKSLLFVIGFFAIITIGINVWFLQKRTQPNSKATKATTLTFVPQTQTVTTGETVAGDIFINPGKNQVSIVKVKLIYDGSKLEASSSANSLIINQAAFPQTLATPIINCNDTQCTISATVAIGANPTKAIQTNTKLATAHFTVKPNATGTTQVSFTSDTEVYSLAITDQASENVLSATSPLTINITNVCQMNQSSCSWDTIPSAITYHYLVIEKNTNTTIQEGDVKATQTSVTFPSMPREIYTCTVTAASECGKGTPGSGTATCPAPSVTPTITPTICISPGMVKNLHIICPTCKEN